MKEFFASVSFRWSGYLTIAAEDNETLDDINKLSDKEILERVRDFSELLDHIDDDDIEVDDITDDL